MVRSPELLRSTKGDALFDIIIKQHEFEELILEGWGWFIFSAYDPFFVLIAFFQQKGADSPGANKFNEKCK